MAEIYSARFADTIEYRNRVWKVLAPFFSRWFPKTGCILDLGAGYCEFVNNAPASIKFAMDLNPDVRRQAGPGVTVLEQDCSEPWPISEAQLDAVFTSNFLEHLPDKSAVSAVLSHAFRALKPGGRFIAMGPNIKYVGGAYWDFYDHYVPLTELSLAEALSTYKFEILENRARFLPYTMSRGMKYPVWTLRLYLRLPSVWWLFGKQFLVVAQRPMVS